MQDTFDFDTALIALLPRLRTLALALTRRRADAEDLVQDAVTNALAARDSFQPGTNFGAWMYRIMRNRFISLLRKQRPISSYEDAPEGTFAVEARHEHRLVLKELARAFHRLPLNQREALLMVAVNDMSYELIAEATGCAVGTAKSRVFRARRQLEAWLIGDRDDVAPQRRGGARPVADRAARRPQH